MGMDPVESAAQPDPRRRLPLHLPSGIKFEGLSHHASLDKLLEMMDYDELRAEQAELRAKGVYRGIGIAASSS
jgi:aerobic carbon-monoxide dehydrogenase large subunit